MRPLSLQIEGFTAFRERQEVDFEPLDLFVITGPTGAGKTSILDAMVFALYGQVPRLGGKHGTSDLVSLGKTQARVMFEFTVDRKGRYRVARRLSRNAAQSATVERLDGDDWISACERSGVRECDRVLRELVGLDFDAFCKAVMLPQGEFHRFLKGDPNERRKVLVSLLGVAYYQRMAERARARSTRLAAGVERTEEILAGQYDQATAEHLADMRARSLAAAQRSTALTRALATADERWAEATRQAAIADTLTDRTADLSAIGVELRTQLDGIRQSEGSKDDAAGALAEAANTLGARRAATERAEHAVTDLEAELGTPDVLAAAAAAAVTLAVTAAEAATAEDERRVAEQREGAAQARAQTAEAREAEHESALTTARADEQRLEDESTAARTRAAGLAQRLADAQTRLDELIAARDATVFARDTAAAAIADAERLRAAHAMAEEHLDQHRRANAVAELAHGLGSGDPCPVCQTALTGPIVVATETAEALESARFTADAARQEAANAANHQARAEVATHAAVTLERKLADALQAVLADHGDDLDALATAADVGATDAATADDVLAGARTARMTAETQRSAAHDAAVEARAAATTAKAIAAAARRAFEDIRRRHDEAHGVLAARFGDPVPADAAQRLADQRVRFTVVADAARAARASLDGAQAAHDTAATAATEVERRLTALDVGLARLQTRADAAAGATIALLAEPGAIATAPTSDGPRTATVAELATWCDTLAAAAKADRHVAAEARDAGEAVIVALATHHELEAAGVAQALAQLRGAEREAREDALNAENGAKQAAERAAEREAMEERIKAEREQITVLDALAHELRADRFVEYIVQETLGAIAGRASEELLRISDGRYSLVAEDGEFDVVDHANADEQRTVKSLSGGETFLASLALALSLSRHVGELATEGLGAKLEAVFIDEGFGTLDLATLDEVIDALERLRAEDLVVGVISHVPELADRIRVGLEVHKDQGRSRITTNTGA